MTSENPDETVPLDEESQHKSLSASAMLADKWNSWQDWIARRRNVPSKYELVTDENTRKHSLWAVNFAVICSAVNTKMLNPNFPIMVSPGAHPDSFPDTEPFDFNSATYFIPMCSLVGVAFASIFVGNISDRIGRKRVMMFLGIVSTVGSIVKWFFRKTFWGFCIANLAFGLFLGNLPVAMAYAGDIFTSKKEKEDQLSIVVGCFVMGNSGGGIIAILMENSGLFSPLWVGSGLMGFSCMIMSWYMIEPGDVRLIPIGKGVDNGHEEEERVVRPTVIDQKGLWNIVGGALLDNIGSTGLFPLCLSPLALEQYTLDFIDAGEEPILSITGYKWLSVMVALMVIPATMMTPRVFARIGAAGACVLGNTLTALVTIGLLAIGNAEADTAHFAGFVTLMYGGFPFTVFSQLTTGPMLDVLAPEDKIGYVQGLNNASMNFGMAFAPWLLGMLADSAGTNTAIWTGIGISFMAAMANSPLMWRKEMGPPEKKAPVYQRVLTGEDEEWATKAIEGEYVPAEIFFELNRERLRKNLPLISPKIKSYDEEKDTLPELLHHAQNTFEFRTDLNDRILSELANSSKGKKQADELCELLNLSLASSKTGQQEATTDLGAWVGDYLQDNGYHPGVSSLLIKQMMLSAFPPISREKEYTPENLEESLLNQRRVMNEYASGLRKRNKYSLSAVVGRGSVPVHYS